MKRIWIILLVILSAFSGIAQSFDGLLKFGGSGDHADNQAGFEALPDNSDFTLELRFRTCATSPASFNLFDYRASTASSGIDAFYSDFLEALQIVIQGESGWENAVYINAPIPLAVLNDGEWKHLAITYNNAEEIAKVYLNGSPIAEEDSVTFTPTNGSFVLGASDLGYIWPFPGEIDELRTSDILRYTANFPPSTTPFAPDGNTVGLWHFDEPEGTNVFTDEIDGLTFIGSETTSTVQIIDNNDIQICPGTEVVLNGHDGFTSYSWSPSTGLNNSGIADPSTTPSNSTSYTLSALLGICSYEDVVEINIGDLNATASGNFSICAGDSTQISVCCGSTYSWSPNTGISNVNSNTPFLFPSETTVYIVDVFESANCADQDTITIVVNPLPNADILASTDTICVNDVGKETLTAVDATAASYQWFPFEAVGCPSCQTTSVLVNSTTTITLVIANEAGCIATSEQLITVLDCDNTTEHDTPLTWMAYPNPFSDLIQLSGLTRDDQIVLRDTSGRIVMEQTGAGSLQTSGLSAGLYSISVISKGVHSHRLLQKI